MQNQGVSTSNPAKAFPKDSSNDLPMAITSPTDFICVPKIASVGRNFSKSKRGSFCNHIIDTRLKTTGSCARNIIRKFIQCIANRKFRCDAAIGNPVALEASALDLETRGFISITITRPVFGWTANWIFEPPVSTPIARMILIDWFLKF